MGSTGRGSALGWVNVIRAVCLCLLVAACSNNNVSGASSETTTPATTTPTADQPAITEPGSDTTGQGLNLTVGQLPETLAPLSGSFTKYINVWGINVVGTPNTNDTKIIHAANVMAQYLDNDADGNPDNPAVIEAMVANNATLVMGATPEELEALPDLEQMIRFVGEGGQGLYGSETAPAYGFDASLEEIHHLILNTGWAQIFGDQLAQTKGSAIAGAMDLARGGRFDTIPSPYPDGAWFTYDDRTCDYSCMVTEYTYWAHTSLLGGQQGRSREIGHEWRLETPAKMVDGDPTATAILQDDRLALPTVLPDGNYQPS